MKTRLIALVLVLASTLGLFGCAWMTEPAEEVGAGVPEGFIGANEDGFLNDESVNEENLINVAAVDSNEEALFQIVYNYGAGLRVEDQCQTLAADIYDATGVTVPVVHSSQQQKTYEIMVGDVARSETIGTIDVLRETLEETDFAICVIGTRVVIYATTDSSLTAGVIFFMDQLVKRSALQGIYGIEKDCYFVYHPNENPEIELLESADDRCVEFKMEIGPAMYTYVRLSYTGNQGWRIQTKYRATEDFRADGASQILAYSLGEYTLGTEDERFYLEDVNTSKTQSALTVTSEDGSRVEINLSEFQMDFYAKDSKEPAATITNIAHNAGNSTIVGTLNEKEAIFGTGERFDRVNQRGNKLELFIKDMWLSVKAHYITVPLLCFSRGSGVFLNNYEHMMLDLDSKKDNTWSASVTGAPLDCYIFTTTEVSDVIYGYSSLSGFADMPEEWSYGMLVNSYGPDFADRWSDEIILSEQNIADGLGEGVYDMIAKMEEYDLPWTGVVVEGWGYYRSERNHAHLKEICEYVHSLGKKVMVYFMVGEAGKEMAGYAERYQLTQTQADGTVTFHLPNTTRDTNNPDAGDGKTQTYIDITNPSAMEWFFGEYWDYLSNDIGIDGCKIDFCEKLPENYELNYFDENIPTAGSHHWYPTAYHCMFWDMISSKPDSGLCFSRGGGIGMQRAPIMWLGDQPRSWDGIRWQLTATLASGMSGLPFMSYDVSGYQYGNGAAGQNNKKIEVESEVFLRGIQYSAFSPFVQSMGKVKRAYRFAEYEGYEYVTELYRAYMKLHEHLTPYITETCFESTQTGMPVMRHLILDWQNDENVWDIDDEYMFGDAFLIAPVLTSGVTKHEVYLPEGKWEDLNTGAVYTVGAEGETIKVDVSIAEIPTFYNMNTTSETAAELLDGIRELYAYAREVAP